MGSEARTDATSIIDGAPIFLGVVGTNAHLQWCNFRWEQFTGSDRELLGRAWLELVNRDDVESLLDALATGDSFTLELRMRRRDGRERWFEMRGSHHAQGTIVAAIDISDTHKTTHGLRLLASVSEELNTSPELAEILDGVARALVDDLADTCTIAVVDDDGRLTRTAAVDRNDAIQAALRATNGVTIDVEDPSAVAEVARTGALLYRPIVDAPGPDEPEPVGLETGAPRSLICAPLRTNERVVGALAVVSRSRPYTPDDVDLVKEVARRCASAVENASLYRRSHDARARLALVAGIGEQLATTFDVDELAATVVRRVVPVVADAATIALFDDTGALRRRAFCHVNPAAERAFRVTHYDTPIELNNIDPPARAATTGRPVLIEDHVVRANGPRPRTSDAVQMLAPTSVIAVPLLTRDKPLGVLTMGFVASGRRYSSADLPLALDLARRLALAFERAVAYNEEHRTAQILQRSMLPDALPDVPGVHLRARYIPGGEVDVGGDWYDVVTLPHARYGLVIGDVAGHGVRAATGMAQLRHGLRAFAADGADPARVLERLNRFLFEQGPLEMATVCYAVLDPTSGALDVAVAAHMPPLIMRPSAPPALLDLPPAPPLGADPLVAYRSTRVSLEPGTTIVLYTDGLVERRGEALDKGLTRIVDAAGDGSAALDDTCERLLEVLLEGARPADDVALLGVHFAGSARDHMRVRRPAQSAELAPMRRILSGWLESAGLGNEEIGMIAVAATEAATNAIEHAYGPHDGWFEIEAQLDDDGGVEITVRDSGRWRPMARGGGGRGLALIGQLMDEFEVRRRTVGTEIWMRRARRGERKIETTIEAPR
jgi:PAS domain S-box-containing protein